MSNDILRKILEEIEQKDLTDILVNRLSSSELNTVLMEVYKAKAEKIKLSDLLDLYNKNRFVKPSAVKPIELLELETKILKAAEVNHFIPIELSPVAVLGSCSVISKAVSTILFLPFAELR